MIQAVFHRTKTAIIGFSVSGHAGYADKGNDIVCAAVTSAVQLTVNAITEILKLSCDVSAAQDEVSLSLPDDRNKDADAFLSALQLHLTVLSEDYPNTIDVKFLEV